MKYENGRWLREPLSLFLILGIGLFVFGELWTRSVASGEERERVAVEAERVEWLQKNFQSRWLRPPTESELRGLVDDYVRREVLYREALGMGLDRDDEVVRRRLVQKLELMTEDLAGQVVPTEAELTAFFQERLDDYRSPERRRFQQVYFNADRRGEAAYAACEELLAELRSSSGASPDLMELGDRFLLELPDRLESEVQVARVLGQRFAAEAFALRAGEWSGPVVSSYGLHAVRVVEVEPGEAPVLDEVRDEVLRDYAVRAQEQTREAIYASLATRYEIVVDEDAIRDLSLRADAE